MGTPRTCRAVASLNATYAYVAITVALSAVAFGLSGAAARNPKRHDLWIAAFVFYAAATVLGVHADGVLRVKLATGMCDNNTVRGVMLFTETFVSIVIVAWLAFSIVLGRQARFLPV